MIVTSRAQRRQLARDNAKMPLALVEFEDVYGVAPPGCFKVMRSRDFMVQMYEAPPPAIARMTVHRTTLDGVRWLDGISWDDLQRLKREAGYGSEWAVEIYPDDAHIVNVANMRHLWLLPASALPFAWGNSP